MDKAYYTIRELVKQDFCPLKEHSIRRLIKSNAIPHINAGRKVLISRDQFILWLQNAHE
ncbi:MAG: helix-turn-helix domain-containing protein [Lachnospiraceae bacterium]|nr:helix-turn-helix domain-containing protein [Lachnospiraceae bacterium]